MDISALIDTELIIFDEDIQSKDELFEMLGKTIEESSRGTKAKKIIKDLYKREKETSTGIEDGFGIPHTKSRAIIKPTVCFVRTGKIQDYRGFDDQPIECVFAIFVPKSSSDVHLEILSSLSRKLMDENLRKKIKDTKNSEDIIRIISE